MIVASYKDAVLREDDIQTLDEGEWLNDAVISFAVEYLSHAVYPASETLVLPPPTSFLLQLADDVDISSVLAPLAMSRRSTVAFFVNNNPNPSRALGGSHWSTLIFTRHGQGGFWHADSCPGVNHAAAQQLANQAARLVDWTGNATVRPLRVPPQANNFDCGLHALAVVEVAMDKAAVDDFQLESILHLVRNGRRRWRDIIDAYRR